MVGDWRYLVSQVLPPPLLTPARAPARTRQTPPTPPLGSAIQRVPTPPPMPAATIDPTPPPGMVKQVPAAAKSLRELEKEGILAALVATGGNKAQAAAILEIDRSTLYKKLKDYDIES
jgi:transcriptional regulator of acetoin/glycerol metabolism